MHVGSWDSVFSIKYLESILFFLWGIKLICKKVLRILFLVGLRTCFEKEANF